LMPSKVWWPSTHQKRLRGSLECTAGSHQSLDIALVADLLTLFRPQLAASSTELLNKS
jgi:hypothetical protein